MALYHFHATIIKRSKGQSAVASAAYRAGVRLYDDRLGVAFDYRRRRGLLYTEILTPQNAPAWMLDRVELWNAVEKAEERKDSQLARSIDISLMHELSFDKNLELLLAFVKEQWVDKGMLADIAIHAPSHDGDDRNIHAHILLTMRDIHPDGFGNKQRAWNKKDEFSEWREAWADHANAMLEREGFDERIDHRSLSERGIGREPTIHIGPAGMQIEHRLKESDRAQKNRDIEAVNDNLEVLETELADSEKRLAELRRQLTAERMEQIQKTVRHADAIWEKAEERIARLRRLQPEGAPSHPSDSAPAPAGGKADSMPDNVSEPSEHGKGATEQDTARQKQAQESEQTRQKQAADDQQKNIEALGQQEKQTQEQAKQEQDRLQQLRDADNKRTEELAKQNAERLARQAEEMRQAYLRFEAQRTQQAHADAYHAEQDRIAKEERRKQEAERQERLAEKSHEGPIRDAGSRYAQALGQNYDIRDPYASLAKSAMAEYAAFRRDRENYDRQIAQVADPVQRQALDLRKRIEGAEYLAITSDRIAQQSIVISGRLMNGRLNSEEAIKERGRAMEYRIQAQDLRQQFRDLQRERTPEKAPERERSEPKPEPAKAPQPRTREAGRYDKLDELVKGEDEKRKAKEQLERESAKDQGRQKQQERERELRRERDRER